jgi:hypothetical protein
MRSLFPDIAIDIEFDDDTGETIDALFQLPGGPQLPVDAAGTSILQASQLLAYIGLFKPLVLILDEPDSHLHPDNQRALCELILRVAKERDFQAIISSHSRHVLDVLKDQASVFWMNKGSLVSQPDVNTTALLLDLGALDSIDYFADGSLKCVVATEDADKKPLETLLWSSGFIEEDTEVASYTGCSKVDAALVLGGFLKDKASNLTLVVHRDADYLGQQAVDKFNKRLTAANVEPFLTEPNDVEGYYINAEHLHYLNPGITLDRIRQLIEDATTQTERDSISALVNQRTAEAFEARRDTGKGPDHGDIAVKAHADYKAKSAELRRGKLVLKKLTSLMQTELKANPRIFVPSPYLTSAKLKAIAAKVWKAPAGTTPAGADQAGTGTT